MLIANFPLSSDLILNRYLRPNFVPSAPCIQLRHMLRLSIYVSPSDSEYKNVFIYMY